MRNLPVSPTDMTRKSSHKVRLMREELGYSEHEWAKLIDGVDVKTVKAWENPELTNSPSLPRYLMMEEIYKRKGATFLTNENTIGNLISAFSKLPSGLKQRVVFLFQEKIRDEK